ncbi:MAG: hypothetical protein IBX64_04120 [Actinobacteria bacterium]|nr:hypothetical protein [Actinomycetota bacterium]
MARLKHETNDRQKRVTSTIGLTDSKHAFNTPGERWLMLTIAGISLRINCSDEELLGLVSNSYSRFLSNSMPDLIIDVEADESLIAPMGPGVSIKYEGDFLSVSREDFHAHMDFNHRRGKITQRRAVYSLDALLRLLVAIKLVDTGGFLLHGASIIKDGKGYIFFGPSGSGKSTIAALSQNYTILGDELTAVCNVDGKYTLYSTPFWGSTPGKTIKASGGLNGIYRIYHGLYNRREKPDVVSAFKTLLPQIIRFDGHKTLIEKITDNAINLLQEVEFYNLYFLPDESFWEVIK